jgi:hypothetical protein
MGPTIAIEKPPYTEIAIHALAVLCSANIRTFCLTLASFHACGATRVGRNRKIIETCRDSGKKHAEQADFLQRCQS